MYRYAMPQPIDGPIGILLSRECQNLYDTVKVLYQREHDHGWGVFGAFFSLPGTDHASSFVGALHDFDGSCTRFFAVYKYTYLSARLHGESNVT